MDIKAVTQKSKTYITAFMLFKFLEDGYGLKISYLLKTRIACVIEYLMESLWNAMDPILDARFRKLSCLWGLKLEQ